MMLLSCNNLKISYDNKEIISNLSFNVESGDYISIVGENGVGKSTLIKAILGLIKINKGNIIFKNGLKQSEIGYIPQENNINKNFPATVLEVVKTGMLNQMGFKFFFSNSQKTIIEKNMKKVGIYDLKDYSFSQLSGGQKQRVLLCRALCATKKMIVLDEPNSGLDPIITKQFYSILEQLNNEGITILMVSHHIDYAISNNHKILHLNKENSFFGTYDEYIKTSSYASLKSKEVQYEGDN